MDVRCESCHTEYELDDGNVKDTGTEVQCTACGHTFTVYPTGATPPASGQARAAGGGPSLAAAEFLLETADGRTHRLRELTMLQKWIIERKVTRADRISRHGQPWARLGTLEDLAPFFDVVDEADRARAAVGRGPAPDAWGAGGRTGAPAAGLGFGALQTPAAGPGLGRAPSTSEGPTGGPRSTPESQRAVNRSLELLAVEAPVLADEPDTSIVMRPSGRAWWKLLVTFSVAGGVFYFGIRALPSLMVKGAKLGAGQVATPGTMPTQVGSGSTAPVHEGEVPGTPSGAEAVAPGAAPAGSASPGSEIPPVAVAPGAASSPGVADPAASPAAAGGAAIAPATGGPAVAPAVVPAPPVVEAPPAPEPPAPAPVRAPAKERADKPHGRVRGVPPAQGQGQGQGQGDDLPYDRLVVQADRLLENGANERALRLYERALAVRPDAPEALTGIGYVHLDRNRTGAAIEFFTKASAASPFAPALFGLGQAYRAAGDPARARQTYQRYLALYPTGSDASAAERNLQALQPGNAAEAPGTILHEGGSGTPVADPAK